MNKETILTVSIIVLFLIIIILAVTIYFYRNTTSQIIFSFDDFPKEIKCDLENVVYYMRECELDCWAWHGSKDWNLDSCTEISFRCNNVIPLGEECRIIGRHD